ncbi:hypothetical protein HNY73_003137 [Argiope bruennichi]|uniref:Uncharacterized protein n=1 Tax=Argiope bruennichi TaxID=94029 RepID=A0A8T0FX37_ARGBR|nr:hypothetical protein HNY73_003137 [Argiope bruennichi]
MKRDNVDWLYSVAAVLFAVILFDRMPVEGSALDDIEKDAADTLLSAGANPSPNKARPNLCFSLVKNILSLQNPFQNDLMTRPKVAKQCQAASWQTTD